MMDDYYRDEMTPEERLAYRRAGHRLPETHEELAACREIRQAVEITRCDECNALRFDPTARKAFAAHLAAVHNTTLVMMDEMR